MSFIASCVVLPVSQLQALREAAVPRKAFLRRSKDVFYDFLNAQSIRYLEFDLNGYYCVTALTWLQEERQIDLMHSEHDALAAFLTEARQSTCFILTRGLRDRYLDSILPDSASAEELTRYFEEFNEQEDPESGGSTITAMRWMKECLACIEAGNTGVLIIG